MGLGTMEARKQTEAIQTISVHPLVAGTDTSRNAAIWIVFWFAY